MTSPPTPKRPSPKPGSLPLLPNEEFGPPHPSQFAVPSFIPADELEPKPEPRKPTPRANFIKLKAAAKKAQDLRVAVRDDAFDEWVRRCTLDAANPSEWTQAVQLYASYLRRAKAYGWNRADKRLSKRELATETRFGILMRDVGFVKTRRAKGWFYPVRLKQGA